MTVCMSVLLNLLLVYVIFWMAIAILFRQEIKSDQQRSGNAAEGADRGKCPEIPAGIDRAGCNQPICQRKGYAGGKRGYKDNDDTEKRLHRNSMGISNPVPGGNRLEENQQNSEAYENIGAAEQEDIVAGALFYHENE